jgi:flagellar motility protein MotE (MotC chaperone)
MPTDDDTLDLAMLRLENALGADRGTVLLESRRTGKILLRMSPEQAEALAVRLEGRAARLDAAHDPRTRVVLFGDGGEG